MFCNKDEIQSKIKTIYLIDIRDFVIEGDTIVRMKRKYGKHKRKVIKLDNGNK